MKNATWLTQGLLGGVVFCTALLCEAATHRGEAGIVRVERIEATEYGPASPAPLQMTKFLRERTADAPLTYMVTWNAGGGVAVGTLLTFEYRQADGGHIRFLAHKCGAPVRGEQVNYFELPEGSEVAAWRVRVVYRGRRLAEATSDLWR